MKYRLFLKIIFACLNVVITFGITTLVPRFLGPATYGEVGYITASMSFVLQFASLASSTAYIYFLSNDKYDRCQINTVYFSFLICVIAIVIILVNISTFNSKLHLNIWSDITDVSYIYLGMFVAILIFVQQRVIAFADCQKCTIISEKIRLFSRLFFLLLLGIAGFLHWLNVHWYYGLFVFSLIAYFLVVLCKIPLRFSRVSFVNCKKIAMEMFCYLKPLIFFTIIASFYSYAGRFALQKSSGTEQQGYYTFAFSISMIFVGLMTSTMTIYMSKMTELFSGDEIEKVRSLFLDSIFKVYALHAFISLSCLIYAKEIILLLAGEKFLEATGALQWLSIFSLLHTFGLLSGNLYFSSGRTKLYGIINSVFMFVGLLSFGYLLFYSSLKLTATMLAAIMTLFYALRVFVQLCFNIKHLQINGVVFLSEFALVTAVILVPLISISYFDLSLVVSGCLSFGVLLMLNFGFKDYVGLKRIADGINQKISI